MGNSEILNNPHIFGKELKIPYSYINPEDRKFIFHSVEDIISPKLQNILRAGNLACNLPFLEAVFKNIENYRDTYNFNNLGDFISNYITIIKSKIFLQKKISLLLNKGNFNGNYGELQYLIRRNFEIEPLFFAYGTLVKEYTERLMNYFLHIDQNLEGQIFKVESGSFYKEFINCYNGYQNGDYPKEMFINDFFNGDSEFLEEFIKTFNNTKIYPKAEKKEIGISNIMSTTLFKQFEQLKVIDNTIDKYMEFKKVFLHDILGVYHQLFGGKIENITEEKLEQAIDTLFLKGEKKYINKTTKPDGIIEIKDNILNKDIGGNKGYNLSILKNYGINIAPGIVLDEKLLEEIRGGISTKKEADLVKYIKKNIGEYIVVRSNFLGEDGSSNSYAGLFDSYINVDTEDVLKYVKKVIISNSQIVEQYNENPLKPGVLIQKFIKGDYSGVIFIQKGNTIIESVKGLNSNLVEGNKTPATYKINGEKIEKIEGGLEENEMEEKNILALKEIGDQISSVFGNQDVDIEFSVKDNCVFIFQVRPITINVKIDPKKISSNLEVNGGNIVFRGDFSEEIYVIENEKDIEKINKDCVIITDKLYRDIAFKHNFIKGIISEKGGYLAHLSILCRELHIPLLTDFKDIINQIKGKVRYVSFKDNHLNFL